MVMASISATLLPFHLMFKVAGSNRSPPHCSHGTYTSGRYPRLTFMLPWPEHASHLPPFMLKEKRPGPYPLFLASGTLASIFLISVHTPMYVAGHERGVLPMGEWSTVTTRLIMSTPRISEHLSGFAPGLFRH